MPVWYDDAMQLRDFADALVNSGYVANNSDVLARPYKYTEEFRVWRSAGMPMTDDDDNWDEFVDGLNSESDEEEEE